MTIQPSNGLRQQIPDSPTHRAPCGAADKGKIFKSNRGICAHQRGTRNSLPSVIVSHRSALNRADQLLMMQIQHNLGMAPRPPGPLNKSDRHERAPALCHRLQCLHLLASRQCLYTVKIPLADRCYSCRRGEEQRQCPQHTRRPCKDLVIHGKSIGRTVDYLTGTIKWGVNETTNRGCPLRPLLDRKSQDLGLLRRTLADTGQQTVRRAGQYARAWVFSRRGSQLE